MTWIYDDGGREAAGFKGDRAGDCVTRSIAIATELEYGRVHDALLSLIRDRKIPGSPATKRKLVNSSPHTGVYKETYQRLLEDIGWTWVDTPKAHLNEAELPKGRLIVRCVGHHLTTLIDGVIYDTHDPSKEGKRVVQGYFVGPTLA